ncbi:MAG: hypothetical protein ACRDHZ_07525 [Ktedonobacteraceae bacterium]
MPSIIRETPPAPPDPKDENGMTTPADYFSTGVRILEELRKTKDGRLTKNALFKRLKTRQGRFDVGLAAALKWQEVTLDYSTGFGKNVWVVLRRQ